MMTEEQISQLVEQRAREILKETVPSLVQAGINAAFSKLQIHSASSEITFSGTGLNITCAFNDPPPPANAQDLNPTIIPPPPDEGEYVLTAQDGELIWEEITECP